ncbi:DUF3775 domain-containing protein [Microbulbifer sp. SAOS-129_SWC]|uniref:DUF3775 domain-containing protein n=1 Tax=Microbulbifer sp. SAOS-129_SWC TaxID=3145235 RepID=UPI00321700D0
MLNVSAFSVCRLIELSREFHAQEAVSIPEDPDNPSGDWSVQMLASHAGDQSFQEFKSIVDDLEPDQQQEVVALLWLGRGDYSEEEWSEALALAKDSWNLRTAEYLIAHPLLSDYLTAGLAVFGASCDE